MKKIFLAVMAILATISSVKNLRAEEPAPPNVTYKDGLHIDAADGKNTLLLNGRLQTRFTYTQQDQGIDTNTFAVQRGEVKLTGNSFIKNLKYDLEVNFATRAAAATSGAGFLNDYNFDYLATDMIGIKAGQFKVPFLYTEISSAMKQEYPDRTLVHDAFTLGRDLGVNIHGSLLDYHLNYSLFGMNGDGQNAALNNANRHFLTGVRFEIPILGEYKYTESDVEYSEKPNMGLGFAYAFNERAAAFQNATIGASTKMSDLTGDLYFKSHGFSFLGSAMLTRTHRVASFTNWGYNMQSGYFLTPQHFELTARAGGLMYSKSLANANQYEYDIGLNYYFNKHNLKWQTEYGMLVHGRRAVADNLTDNRIRSQVTLVF